MIKMLNLLIKMNQNILAYLRAPEIFLNVCLLKTTRIFKKVFQLISPNISLFLQIEICFLFKQFLFLSIVSKNDLTLFTALDYESHFWKLLNVNRK